jgi:heme exporter protein C
MHAYANPAKFLGVARPLTLWTFWSGVLLVLAGVASGLWLTPPDYLQGASVRIMYIHIPAAWLGMAGWTGIAAASLAELVWRHPLAGVAARALAPVGALFTGLCLLTGSIWGRPTWGTWWEWDGRLTAMLVLLFLYFGYIGLANAAGDRSSGRRIVAIFGLVGAINLPIIRYSVVWWNSLHQGQSIRLTGETTIAGALLWPLPLTILGFSLLFCAITLMRMRTILAETKVEARLKRMAAE